MPIKKNNNHWIVPLRDSNSSYSNSNSNSKRTEKCEFCGIYFDPAQTTLKLVHNHIRSVCMKCLEEMDRMERGEDLTK